VVACAVVAVTLSLGPLVPHDVVGGAAEAHPLSGRPVGPALAAMIKLRSSRSRSVATHTSCRSVVYIGDSTSDGEALAEFVPERRLRAPAQLSRVGVRTTHMEVSGARSIHETFEGIPNAATVAQQEIQAGFHGCWILALGTNEAADVAAGSTFSMPTRIAQMMSIIGNQPVMWVNAITLSTAPQFYGNDGMQRWNQDLLAACRRHPMMRVYDWAAHAKSSWFIPDGIHYTPAGYIARTRLIAKALVAAFPSGQPLGAGANSSSPGCEVQ
jgi:lysophospholipase L1-like esterase